ncbi:TonB-dependent receptor [Planctobacterium marinum]|uniref:TonB-dependent receptor n=1 Tax=Planctobacterium marinum TaxID=1631968 RepID=UPI001E47C10D|nr:TonB-dependent receptor plug domain-containing protein [Planctobacterium marinum]MCC2604310.1 TonB-dependent receptor plug domain-containing protein [Planctobacterium marinum]
MNTHRDSNRLLRTSLLCAAIQLALSGTVNAQESEDEASEFEAITVTATKRAQVIYEVPIAISAFQGDALAEQGISDLTDVGKFVPNLNVTGFSAGHTSSANPFIRGIGLQDHLITTDPGVSVYVDGVYLGRQVGQNWSLSNIERIEVLRGPQGTLYGRNSIGGAINIITKQPNEVNSTKVNLEAGTRGRLRTDIFTNRELSPGLAFNMNIGYTERDGLGEFYNLENPKWDVGETQEVYGRFSVKYEPSDSLRFILTADGNNGDGGLRPYTALIDELGPDTRYTSGNNGVGVMLSNDDVAADIYDNATGTDAVNEVSNSAHGVSFTTEWDISDDLMMKIIASHRSSEYKAGLDDDATVYALDHYPERGSAEQDSVELQFSGYLGESADFVAGLYWFQEEGDNRQGADSSFDAGGNTLQLDQKATSKAAFVNVGYDVSDALRLSGGLRYTEDEKDASANVFPALGTIYDADEWDELSWELAGNYTFDNGMNAYATIQTGYQGGQYPARPYCLIGQFFGAGGFDDLDNAIETVNANNCFTATENITAVNYEVGVKGRLTDYLDMSIALFNTEYDDLPYQVSQVSDAGFDTANLVVSQTSRGVEFDSNLTLGNFSLQTSIGFMDVEVDEQLVDGTVFTPVAPLTPEWTIAFGPAYEFFMEDGASVKVRVDYSWRDDMYGEPSSAPERMTLIEDRTLVNMDISYTPGNEAYTVGLYGRNIFDERYDNARLNTGDYVLRILSNDASEFGVRFTTEW